MEVIIGSGIAALIMFASTLINQTDRDKIRHTFKNLNYQVKDHKPRLIRQTKSDTHTIYTYNVPYGLVDDDKLKVLEKVLNKSVDVSFVNQKLHIKVYNNKLPRRVDYDWNKTDGWTIPVGKNQEGTIYHDFDKIPHMTVAGMTRQGKTVLLKLIFSHLINNHADDVEFHIIDLKGGLEFGQYSDFKQVKIVASDVNEAHNSLQSIQRQIKADMREFKAKRYTNIVNTQVARRRFVIVDEGAELTPARHHTKEEKNKFNYCQHVLSEIARVAGALGYRLIFATQYPTADTLPRQVKQNSDAKISFRLPTDIASRVAIDESGAERIDSVGRAIYRTVDKKIVQVPYIDDKDILKRLGDNVVTPTTEKEPTLRTDIVKFG